MNTQRPDPSHPGLDTSALPADGPSWLAGLAIFAILAITLGFPQLRSTGMFNLAASDVIQTTAGSAKTQLVYGSCFLAALLVGWGYQRQIWRSFQQNGPLLPAFLLLCAASLAWSPYPMVTLKRVVQLGGLFLIGYLATLPGLRTAGLERALRYTLTAMLVLSMLMALLLPQYGVDASHQQAWHGIFWQKNSLGAGAAVCALLWLHHACNHEHGWRLPLVGLAFSLLMVLMSRSSTSLLILAVASALYVATRYLHFFSSRAGFIAALGLGCAALAALQIFYVLHGQLPTWSDIISPLAAMLGKDPDLTGRTQIWALLGLSIKQHPWLGIGYGAFWIGPGGPAQYIADQMLWMPSHGHNGYLDMLNELGLAGLMLLVLILVVHFSRLARLSRYDSAETALHFGLFSMIVIGNFSESNFLLGLSFQNCLFIYSAMIVSTMLAEYRTHHAPAQDAVEEEEGLAEKPFVEAR